MKHLKLFISHCWYSLICLYFFSVSSVYKILCSASADILSGISQWTQTECFSWFLHGSFFGCHLPSPFAWSLFWWLQGLEELLMLGCSQCQVLHTFTGWVSCIFSSVLYLTAWVPCVFIYSGALQSMNVLTLLGNNVGKWHFGFVGTIKRSVFTARFFNTVTLTSHCLVNQLCQQL